MMGESRWTLPVLPELAGSGRRKQEREEKRREEKRREEKEQHKQVMVGQAEM